MRLALICVLICCVGCASGQREWPVEDAVVGPLEVKAVGPLLIRGFGPPKMILNLDLESEATPVEVARGDTVSIVLTVTNNRTVTQFVDFSSGCKFGFALLSREGEMVAPEPIVCTTVAQRVEFEPGYKKEFRFNWTWDSDNIAAGEYLLRAGFGPYGELCSAPPVILTLR